MKFLFLLISFLYFSSAMAEDNFIVKEEWISPDIDNFDCHSSSIVETTPGQFCVVWKGGPGSGHSNKDINRNVGVWLSLFHDGWSRPTEIINAPESVCWNPVLCKNPANELILFYRIGSSPRSTVSFLKRSLDQGEHWSREEILPAGIIGPTKNKPIFTDDRILISPSSVETGGPEDLFKATACWIEISDDNGHTWKKIGPLEISDRKFGVIEPVLFYDTDHNLRMMCRDRANRIGGQGYIWMAISKDKGLHWSDLKQTTLPNPDSAFDIVDLGQGKLILVYNHSHTNRFPLNLALSFDGGNTWSEPLLLAEKGEFPSSILGSDGLIHITYASYRSNDTNQRGIKHVVINPVKLRSHTTQP